MNRKPITLLLLAVVATCLSVLLHPYNPLLPHFGSLHSNTLSRFASSSLINPAMATEPDDAALEELQESVIAAAPSTLPQSPRVSIRYRYYPIVGTSAAALRQQMSQMGPQSQTDGKRYDARTDWHIHWAYNYARRGGRCAITSVNTRVDVLYILPGWTAPRNTPVSLMAEWQRYMGALKTHEIGHKDHGVGAGVAVLKALQSVTPKPTCQALQTAINATLQQTVSRFNQKDIDYDRATRHGFTQGAVFPSRATASAEVNEPSSLQG